MRTRPLLMLLLALPLLGSGARCGGGSNSPELVRWARDFVPYRDYGDDCFSAWADSASLLAAMELHRRGAKSGFEVTPAEADPYVRHMAQEVERQFYDASHPNGWGACIGYLAVPLPDPPTGLAAMVYMLGEFGESWSQQTVDALRRAIHLPDWEYDRDKLFVYNKMIPFAAAYSLFGEKACHAPSWERGWAQTAHAHDQHIKTGGFEANDRHYTMFHLANLGLMLDGLETPAVRDMALHLFDLKMLLSAHLYLPGGHIGVLNTRMSDDPYYYPGSQREKDMGPMLESLAVGSDFQYGPGNHTARASVVVAELLRERRPVPTRIQELFFERSAGYDAWWLMRSSKSAARYPGTITSLGEGGRSSFAWQWHVLPGGGAALGSGYGEWAIAAGNSEGVAVRCEPCEQGFAFLLQWAPCKAGDTDDFGSGICGSADLAAADQKDALYDFERMQVHRSRISLFDPRERPTRWAGGGGLIVPRGHALSQTWLTNWDHPAVGGEKIFPTAGGWYVGRVGDVFVAYRPLGDVVTTTERDGKRLFGAPHTALATFFQMPGRSGGITEIALASDFPGDTLGDFAADLDARYWSFTADGPNGGPVAEFDYRSAGGALCRMKLEYLGVGGIPGKERRSIDCSAELGAGYQEQSDAAFFAALQGGVPLSSPFTSYDIASDVLRVLDPDGPDVVYDLGAARDAGETVVTPLGCEGRAYLELAESEGALAASSDGPLPTLDLALANNGFVATTATFSFLGDDCTVGAEPPNDGWLVAPAEVALLPAAGGPLAVPAGAGRCDPGLYTGELVVRSSEGNAAEARLPVTLAVTAGDRDGDGASDAGDNCTHEPNGPALPDAGGQIQLDVDGDGIGNACDGDFNQDGLVGGPDFDTFLQCFDRAVAARAGPSADPSCAESDLNGDAFVGGPDFDLFARTFGGPPGPASPGP